MLSSNYLSFVKNIVYLTLNKNPVIKFFWLGHLTCVIQYLLSLVLKLNFSFSRSNVCVKAHLDVIDQVYWNCLGVFHSSRPCTVSVWDRHPLLGEVLRLLQSCCLVSLHHPDSCSYYIPDVCHPLLSVPGDT